MILSMTGFGRTECQFRGRKLVCEVRSLNSKVIDMSVRLAPCLRAHELELRTQVTRRVERGKVDLAIYEESDLRNTAAGLAPVNWEVANEYAAQYKEHVGLLDSNGQIPAEVMAAILRLPDVVKVQDDSSDMTDDEWKAVQKQVERTLDAFDAFRIQEGAALQAMFTEKLDQMTDLLAQVEPFEKGRVAKIKERLEQNLAQLSAETQQQTDRNRLEQEMIYYLEILLS